MARQTVYEMNLVKLVQDFGSEEKCRGYLESLRWPDGACCPRCQSRKVSRIHDRGQFDCDSCRFQFSVTSGTMLHDTHLPLWKWLLAVYTIVESKKGVSANQLMRTLRVSYRTAWYLCHRIRKAMESKEGFLRGIVEVDETWVGGKTRGRKHKTGAPHIPKGNKRNKTLIIGAVSREGVVRMTADPERGASPDKANLGSFIRANIAEDAMVYTDERRAYKQLLAQHGNQHEAVRHKNEEWVRTGDIHTNTMEGAWGLFKRSVVGSYHQLSCKHMNAYLDEFEYRYNNRKNPHIFRDALKLLLVAEHVGYRELVDGDSTRAIA